MNHSGIDLPANPNKVAALLQDTVDIINGIDGIKGHAVVLMDEEDVKKLAAITAPPAIGVIHGGLAPFGDQRRGGGHGLLTTMSVEVFVVADVSLLCETPTPNADFKMLDVLWKLREALKFRKGICQNWRFRNESPREIEGLFGYLQTWQTEVPLFIDTTT